MENNYFFLKEDKNNELLIQERVANKGAERKLFSTLFEFYLFNRDGRISEESRKLTKSLILPTLSAIYFSKHTERALTLIERFEMIMGEEEEDISEFKALPDASSKFYFVINTQYEDFFLLKEELDGKHSAALKEYIDFYRDLEEVALQDLTYPHVIETINFLKNQKEDVKDLETALEEGQK